MLEEYFNEMNRNRREMHDEFTKLCLDPSAVRPNVGDRVVVAIGLIGYGFNWIRQECVVIEEGETSFKVRWQQHGNTHVEWINPNLITDVLPPEATPSSERSETP